MILTNKKKCITLKERNCRVPHAHPATEEIIMKCAICDDQALERMVINHFILQFERENNIECSIDEYDCAESFLKATNVSNAYDVVFMDIFMAEMNGFEATKLIYKKGFTGCIIFTTNSRDFAIESYSVEASGYLVKPCLYEDFNQSMLRVKEHWNKSKKKITVLSQHSEFTVYYKDIQLIETSGKGSILYIKEETLQTSTPIGKLEAVLCAEDNFIRVGKSYLLNMNYVDTYDADSIIMKNALRLPLPIRNKAQIKKKINDYRFLCM